ncbi:hypothetical protein PTTG_30057 [Puccinia triticina 1-1 BBBD Race 1]|uniref:Reverse transcriptase domain-containing protein n=1 Tax=Puccinia triticina (isolate 1-1 / race 1 (BBBD)) TaxID=630390 RepID=A0A180G115_PUCT1|nr:hypothetical protein PTTG_30057 [Puccinia triticina 1-1 BBBD Race 1]
MSEVSNIAPLTPIRNSPVYTPSLPSPTALPIPNSSQQFFLVNTPSPFDHNSPSFMSFSPRYIPTTSPRPQQGPSNAGNQNQLQGPSNSNIQDCRPVHPIVEDDISALLLNLKVNNSTQSTLIQAQAASIALLNAQARQDKTAITNLQAETKNIKDIFHAKLMKTQATNNQSIAHPRGLFEGSTNSLGGSLGQLEVAGSQPTVSRIFVEPPHQSHIFFTGSPRETNNFCFTMRNTFERIGEQFNTEKQKILWILGYFWAGPGRMDGEVPSYTWWRGLLSNNAAALNLPTLKALSRMEYVLAELHDVDLGPWNGLNNLGEKQEIAVSVAKNLAGVTKILDPRSNPSCSHNPPPSHRLPAPSHQQPAKVPDGDAMDLDEVAAAMKNANFLYADFRQECVDRNICIRCSGAFDDAHYQKQGCTLGADMKMDMTDMLQLWEEWGGSTRKKKSGKRRDSKWAPENLSRRAPSGYRRDNSWAQNDQNDDAGSDSPVGRLDKGKKRQSLAEVNRLPFKKRSSDQSGHNPSDDPVLSANAIDVEDMSAGEVFFNTCMSQRMSAADCKQTHFVKKTARADNRPFFNGSLLIGNNVKADVYVLVDSGASASFIDIDFAKKIKIEIFDLPIKVQCKSFDGSAATSGEINSYAKGDVLIPTVCRSFLCSQVTLYLTKLASANIILGNSWLKNTGLFVGGSNCDVVMYDSVQEICVADCNEAKVLTQEFADVFVTESLARLPPHRGQFDCKVNLKEGAIPPFGKMYNLSKLERDELKTYVDDNLAKGFIRLSSSSAAAPIFYVKVEGKANRPCVDYRILNNMTVRDSYPLPVIAHLLNNLQGCKFLSKIDLKAAFNLLRVADGHE